VLLKRILDEDERLIFAFGDDLTIFAHGQRTEETQHLLGGELCASTLVDSADFGVLPLLPAETVPISSASSEDGDGWRNVHL
jgi:hypothetical protein